jgi:endonuclease/exonuclease/phosphatase family metal-dependent hydrolase
MALAVIGFIGGYFLNGWLAACGLILAQLVIVAGAVFTIESATGINRPTHWRYPLGLIWMLILNFFSAFAFTYPYTLPMMRGRGWLVHLIAILFLGWGVVHPTTYEQKVRREGLRLSGTIVALATILIAIFVWPRAPEPLPQDSLRLATWNIHYGYDDDWHTNLQEMAEVIASEGVDVIAMQEVDTGRMTSYSSDNAYFLARQLGMQVVYLPAVEHLTGIALLYKGPTVPSSVAFLTSLQEQTGVVHASLDWGSAGLDAYGIWMGLSDEDTLRQIDEALAFIGTSSPASFGGDFNSLPEDPEIDAVRAAAFADPFDLLGVANPAPTSPAIDPQERIDFVWLRGLVPLKAWVSESLASDHRMVVVEVVQP